MTVTQSSFGTLFRMIAADGSIDEIRRLHSERTAAALRRRVARVIANATQLVFGQALQFLQADAAFPNQVAQH